MRIVRGTLKWFGLAVGFLLFVVALVFALAQTGWGKRWIVGFIEDAASSPGFEVEIGSLEGFLPFGASVADVAISADGVPWLTIDRAALDWSIWSLIGGEVSVQELSLGRVALTGLPPTDDAAPEPERQPTAFLPSLPDRPINLNIQSLSVEEFVLGEAVVGQGVAARIEAAAAWDADGLSLDLSVVRTDGRDGAVDALIDLDPGAATATVDISIREPPGGVLADLMGLRDDPAVALTVSAEGPLRDWRLTLSAQLDEVEIVSGRLTVSPRADSLSVDADLTGDVGRLLPDNLGPLVGDRLRAEAAATITADDRVIVDRADIDAPGLRLTAEPAGADTLEIQASVGAPSLYAGLLGPAGLDLTWDSIAITGTVGRSRPRGDLRLAWTGVAGLGGAIDPLVGEGSLRIDIDRAEGDDQAGSAGPPGWTLNALSVDLPWARADFSGSMAPTRPAFNLAGSVAVGDLSRLSALSGQPLAGALSGDVSLTVSGSAVTVTLDGAAGALDTGLAPANGLLGATPSFALAAAIDQDGIVRVDTLNVEGEALALSAQGSLEGDAVTASGDVRLPRLSVVAPDLDGEVALSLTVGGTLDRPRLEATLDAPSLSIGGTGLAPLAGSVSLMPVDDGFDGGIDLTALWRDVPLSVAGALSASQDLNAFGVDDLAIGVGEGQVAGALDIALSPLAVAGDLNISDVDLAPLAPLIGQDLAGLASLDIALSHDAASGQQIVATVELLDLAGPAGVGADGVTGQVRLTDVLGTPAGRVSVIVAGLVAPGARVDSVSAVITPDLAADSAGLAGSASGIAIDDVGTIAQTSFDLALSGLTAGVDGVVGQIVSQDLDLAGNRAGQLAIDLDIAGPWDSPTGTVDLDGQSLVAGGQTLGQVTASLAGGLDQVTIDASASGAGIDGAVGATVAMDGDGTIRANVNALSANAFGLSPRLVAPATVTVSPTGAISIGGTRIALLGGVIAIAGVVGEALSLSLTIEGVQLATVADRFGLPAIAGSLSGDVGLSGTPAAPSATIDLGASGLASQQTLDLGLSAFSAQLQGTVSPQRAELTGSLSGSLGDLNFSASGPLDATAFDASATGSISLAALTPLVAASGSRITGGATVDLTASGPVASPDISGTITISDGGFSNGLYGVALTDISGTARAAGDRIDLDGLQATTPNGGRLNVTGQFVVASGALDARLTVDDARLVNLPQVSVEADADLALTAGAGRTPGLSGTVSLTDVRARIAGVGSASVPVIEVEETNPVTAEQAARIATAAERADRQAGGGGGGAALALNVTVSSADNIYIDGLGLSAQLGGSVDLGGTTADPRLVGDFELRRGTFEILGRRLEFSRGVVLFDGNPFSPRVDFEAEARAGDATAIIGLEGPAADPQLTIDSIPPLPDDEILARLLFGKGTRDLSAIEAAQLAREVAALTGIGGGPDLLGQVQSALGIDNLDVSVGGDAGEETTIGVTEEVIDNVRVGVEQGLSGESGEVTVEIEITPNITIDSAVGDQGSEVGVSVEWEY